MNRYVFIVTLLGVALVLCALAVNTASFGGTKSASADAGYTTYASSAHGVSFSYRDAYTMRVQEGAEGRVWVLSTSPSGAAEEPPAITIRVFKNPQGLPLVEWAKQSPDSGFHLSDGRNHPGLVGGKVAMYYAHTGLYETDAVAVAVGNKVYLFEAGWMDAHDQIRRDFTVLLESVTFN